MSMTCENAEKLLKASGEPMPDRFRVVMVASCDGAYLCKWEDQSAEALNRSSVSDPSDPETAVQAHQALSTVGVTALWLNDGEDGKGKAPAAHTLDRDDITLFKGGKFKVEDVR